MQVENPPKNLTQKEKAQWSTGWVGLPETEMSIEPIIPKNLFIIPNKKIMSMEYIFQDINK